MEKISKKNKRAKRILSKKLDQNLNQSDHNDNGYIIVKSPKKWSHLYLRSCKLKRAKQLGIEYPRKSKSELKRDNSDL